MRTLSLSYSSQRLVIMNESKRQKKVARLLQKELGDIFQKDKRNILENAFVTIMDVGITPDLSIARVYISMMLVKNQQELIDKINHRKSEIRGILGRIVGKQLRIIPDLEFYIDEIQGNASRLDTLIDNLNIPPADVESEKDNNDKIS